MADPRSSPADEDADAPADALADESVESGESVESAVEKVEATEAVEAAEAEPAEGKPADSDADGLSTEELRRQVEEEYDFDDFGPADMERMSAAEWEAVFDPETWITGDALLDRVEADLKDRVVRRDVFARVERLGGSDSDGPDRIVAYSDEGYAVVYPDGSVEGQGTVLRDVKPTVALCSMEGYDVPEMPEGDLLPRPMEVPEGSGEFGNLMVQLVAAAQVLAGLALFGIGLLTDIGPIVLVIGLIFLAIGVGLLFTVANARLSDRFRAEEYRNRLRAVGIDSDERPAFLPDDVEAPAELKAAREAANRENVARESTTRETTEREASNDTHPDTTA